MPCIAIGPEEEEEDESPATVVWATSCALGSSSGAASENVTGGAPEEDEPGQDAEPSLASSPWKNKRVIFLEIDGILNTRPDVRMVTVEKLACKQLRRLVDASDAEIVLTSSWRRHHEYVLEVLRNFGALPESRREIYRAPWNANPERRDLEILQWVNAHRDIAGWVALDARDLLRFASAARLQGHVIQVDPIHGLTGDVVAEALRCLGCHGGGQQQAGQQRGGYEAQSGGVPQVEKVCDVRSTGASPAMAPEPAPTPAVRAATSSLKAVETDLASSLRSALGEWDADLCGKMEALLGSLPRAECEGQLSPTDLAQDVQFQFPRSDSSRAEFEDVLTTVRDKFSVRPEK